MRFSSKANVRRFLIALCVLLSAPYAEAAAAYVNGVCCAGASANTGCTTASTNMTGANFFIVSLGWVQGITEPTITDTSSNTWRTTLNAYHLANNNDIHPIYAWNASSSGTQTFTVSDVTGSFASMCVLGFSGVQSSSDPFDAQNGTADSSNGTFVSTGSITPSVSGEVVVSGLTLGASGSIGGATIDSSMTIKVTVDTPAAGNYADGMAELIQSSAGPIDPQWQWTGNQTDATFIVSFKAAAGGAACTPTLTLLGVGRCGE